MSRDRHQVKVLQSQMENVGARARTISAAAKACRRRSGGRGCPSVASHTGRSRRCVIRSCARRYAARDLTGPVPARRPSLLAAQGRRPFVTPGCTRNMTMPILNPAFAVLGRLCPRKAGGVLRPSAPFTGRRRSAGYCARKSGRERSAQPLERWSRRRSRKRRPRRYGSYASQPRRCR